MKRSLQRFLRRRGATAAEIQNAAAAGYLSLLVLDREIMPGARRYTMADLARRAGVDLPTARQVWRAVGFPDLPDDLPAFTEADVATLRAFHETFDRSWLMNWNVDRGLRQARVVSSALARIADSVTDDIARSFREAHSSGLEDHELAELLAEQIDASAIIALIDHAYRLQLRAAVWRRLARLEPGVPGTTTGAVGFVDLVGYTALAEGLDDDELAVLVGRFGDVAHDTVTIEGGRIVKTIGDEVMFVTDTAGAAAAIALRLTERSTGDELLPEARAGVAHGQLLSCEGDYFGPVVNLASRLTEIAHPSEVLVSAELAGALGSDARFVARRMPPKRIRDIGRVELYRLGRAPQP